MFRSNTTEKHYMSKVLCSPHGFQYHSRPAVYILTYFCNYIRTDSYRRKKIPTHDMDPRCLICPMLVHMIQNMGRGCGHGPRHASRYGPNHGGMIWSMIGVILRSMFRTMCHKRDHTHNHATNLDGTQRAYLKACSEPCGQAERHI